MGEAPPLWPEVARRPSGASPRLSSALRRVSSASRALTDALLAVLLAPLCAACGRPHDRPTRGAVCERCWTSIVPLTPPFCDTCGDPLPSWRVVSVAERRCPRCRRRSRPIALARAVGAYEGSLRAIVHALKYDCRRSVAAPLARAMRIHGRQVLAGADAVVPVPLFRTRRRARGFNQAADLARHIGLPVLSILTRTRDTPSQTDLPSARRHANVRHAFRVVRPAGAAGACLVLIDDVSTTGATLDACALALLNAGAREVRALTAARVVSRPR
jgi:ComF family protein